MARKTSKHLPHSQVIYKEYWKLLPGGGQLLEYVIYKSGDGLLEKTQLSDIKPNKTYYMQDVYKINEFRPTTFDPSVEFRTIEELHKTGRIWQLIQE